MRCERGSSSSRSNFTGTRPGCWSSAAWRPLDEWTLRAKAPAPLSDAEVAGVAVVVNLAEGRKCARSWKISHSVGSDPQFPDVTPRDAQALREWETMRKAAG